jgi:transcriptional regulator GlxA family with amidase domain
VPATGEKTSATHLRPEACDLNLQPSAHWDDGMPTPSSAKISPSIRAAIAFIEQNFADPIPLSDLASMSGLSLHRFVTVFRSQVGIPPHQYVCRTRVREARNLLSQGVPPAAVALDTGFCDQSHLSRHFKRQCGITPGHFAGTRRPQPLPPLEPQPCA